MPCLSPSALYSLQASNRREFLLSGAALVVSFSIPAIAKSADAAELVENAVIGKPVTPDEVDSFLSINAQGDVTVYSGKVELGTGVRTALIQIVAEELDLPIEKVSIVEGDTALTPDQGVTAGSLSIEKGGMQLR